MPEISNSVGEGGKNLLHDVALVQAMLRVINNPKGSPYLVGSIDGEIGEITKTAILAFQTDNKLKVELKGVGQSPATLASGADVTTEKPRSISGKNSPTFKKLVQALPATHKEMMALEKTKTVYLAGSTEDSKSSQDEISTSSNLVDPPRGLVKLLVEKMFGKHRMVLWVTKSGFRRSFEEQSKITNTDAGPGESNHNFGLAVDIGFRGLRWLNKEGVVITDDDWLNKLADYDSRSARVCWDARDAIAMDLGLFRLSWERIHLQSYDQGKISSARSLVDLLNRAGKLKWGVDKLGPPNHYKSDLGFGGSLVVVGTALEIWSGSPALTKAKIVDAKNSAQKSESPGASPGKEKTVKLLTETDVKDEEVTKLKEALKADFQLADDKFKDWKPISK